MPSPREWAKHLHAKIVEQEAYAKPWEDRYRNEHVLPFIQREYAEVYGTEGVEALTAIQPPRTGTAAVVVDALVERLTVLGAEADVDSSDAAEAVRVVQAAWEASDLDVMHREAHREALIKRESFVQVSRSADGARAIVGIDAPEQMAVHREPGPPYDVDAALKVSIDEWTGLRTARLWLPGEFCDIREPKGARGAIERWDFADLQPSGFEGVPVVQMAPRARLLASPESEVERIASLVDIVDLIEGLLVFAGHFGAVPIRWVTGLEVPRDPKDPTKVLLDAHGKPMVGFNPRADHLWVSTKADAKFGQLTPATLETFIAWAEHASSRIRARTGIASTYLSMNLKSHMSAELLKTDEAPMVRRVRAMGEKGSFGQGWRRVQQLILDVERPDLRVRVRPRWESPQTRIEAQDADVFSKLAPSLGAKTTAQRVLGWSKIDADAGAAEAAAAKLAADPFAALLGKPMIGDPASDA